MIMATSFHWQSRRIMKKATLTYLLLLETVLLCFSQDVMIFPARDLIMVPSLTNILMPGVPLSCGLEPDTLERNVNYTTRWILPGQEIVDSTGGRFVFSENMVSINSRALPGTVLIVTALSYQDAGTYTCEGRSTAPGASTQWASTNIELWLNLELLSNTSTIVATIDDSAVALHCEMRAFIRPDSSLIWEGPGGQINTTGTEKYYITFSDGSPEAAANGGALLVPSRVSTLTIINPEPSDAGSYTCTVVNTSEAIVINVRVNVTYVSMTVTDSTPPRPNATDHSLPLTGIIVGCVTAILVLTGLLVIGIAIMHCLISRCSRRNKNRESNSDIDATQSSNPVYYDYISLEPDRGVQHNGQLDTDEAKDDNVSINVNPEGCGNHDNLNASTMMTVDPDMNIESDVNVAYGVTVDGVSAALEVNVAYGTVDTVMEENEAYGVATDGIGIDVMKKNVAYGAITSNED